MQASTASRKTKDSTSVLNWARYSADADARSASIASSMICWGIRRFMVRVGACQTSTGLSLP